MRLRVTGCAVVIAIVMNGLLDAQERIRVGSKSFTENVILGEMIAHLVRDAGGQAEHHKELGGTQILFKALLQGDIDVYPEYTGTLAGEILSQDKPRDDDEIRQALAGRGIRMSQRLGFNNTYALGMKEDAARRLGITKISDLSDPRYAGLKLGFSDEFMNRDDGWPGLKALYRLPHVPRGMDHNLAYRGIDRGSIDLTDLYSTDAEVRYYKLRLLEDDRGYFPVYHCVLLYRADLDAKAPQVIQSIKRLEGAIDNAAMTEMNARAKLDRTAETIVAADFLRTKLDIQVDLPENASQSRFRELASNLLLTTRQHLLLVVISLAASIAIGLPLGIWAYKWPRLAQPILGTVGVIQTLPSMAVLVFMIPLLGLGPRPAIVALFLYSLLPIVRGAYAGLREIPGTLQESAIVLGLSRQARLWRVEIPLASRSMLSGIKTAAVINVGTATIGALIGAGGYGQPILTGIRLDDLGLILQGAVPAAVMALVVQGLFDLGEAFVVPQGLRIAAGRGGA